MNTPADKKQEDKSKAVATSLSELPGVVGNSALPFVDGRSESVAQRKIQDIANNSLHSKQTAQLQVMANSYSNNTGLPDNLKSGIENLSGYSMDDVKVHYNSDKPAQLSAHAYAQGTNIHIASGQEQHLSHEAWHVVQQKQGRVKPTLQMKGEVMINDDAGLEREADVMGAKSLQMGQGHTDLKNVSGISSPTVQRSFNPALNLKDATELKEQLIAAGYEVKSTVKLMTWFNNELSNTDRVLADIHSIAQAIINREHGGAAIIVPVNAEVGEVAPVVAIPEREVVRAEPLVEMPEQEVAINEPARVEGPVPVDRPALPIKEIAVASEQAQAEAERQVKHGADVMARREMPEASMERDRGEEKKVRAPKGDAIIVNYVWFGSKPMGALEKFNIYSWRTLGHTVNIYTHPFGGDPPRTVDNLGLKAGDATVIDLSAILDIDDHVEGEGSPKVALGNARSILKYWLSAIPKEGMPTMDHIYNMVDLTKSYIGGTQRGIVLDTKVGPSPHLQAYTERFKDTLISYTRGGNTSEMPENQSIGTMQESEELRLLYAKSFNSKLQYIVKERFNDKVFDLLTGYHGRSYMATKRWLDVATKTPDGQRVEGGFKVSEPGNIGHGPFRVFKMPSDQTNKPGAARTDPRKIKEEAEKVLRTELPPDGAFTKQAEEAMNGL